MVKLFPSESCALTPGMWGGLGPADAAGPFSRLLIRLHRPNAGSGGPQKKPERFRRMRSITGPVSSGSRNVWPVIVSKAWM